MDRTTKALIMVFIVGMMIGSMITMEIFERTGRAITVSSQGVDK